MGMTLQRTLKQAAALFRLGQEAQAALEWRSCIIQLEQQYPTLLRNTTFQQILPLMLQAQERHNWLGLADYIEFELIELLEQYKDETQINA